MLLLRRANFGMFSIISIMVTPCDDDGTTAFSWLQLIHYGAGVDVTSPRFSWALAHSDRGQVSQHLLITKLLVDPFCNPRHLGSFFLLTLDSPWLLFCY
jgi:hypothetical protein